VSVQISGSSTSVNVVAFASTKSGAHSGQIKFAFEQAKSSAGSIAVSHSGQGFGIVITYYYLR